MFLLASLLAALFAIYPQPKIELSDEFPSSAGPGHWPTCVATTCGFPPQCPPGHKIGPEPSPPGFSKDCGKGFRLICCPAEEKHSCLVPADLMRLDPSLRFPREFEDGAGYRSALEKRVLGGAGISRSVMAEGGFLSYTHQHTTTAPMGLNCSPTRPNPCVCDRTRGRTPMLPATAGIIHDRSEH